MNLGEHLIAVAERRPEAEAMIEDERRWSYGELFDQSKRVAGGLSELGLGSGERLAVALANRSETVLLYWAAQWLGATFVPLNWRLSPADLQYCVNDSRAKVIALEERSAYLFEDLKGATQVIGVGQAPGVSMEQLLAATPASTPSSVDERETCLILYTSGTTGRPKGVPRSHRAEQASAEAHVIQCRYEPGERTLGVMPIYHTMGMRSLLAMSMVSGCLIVQPQFRAGPALKAVHDEKVSALYLAPTLFHDLIEEANRQGGAPQVQKLAYAGAPMTATLAQACASVFKPSVFVNHYGSTEIYTFAVSADQLAKPGCAGRAGLHERIRLVRPQEDAGPNDLIGGEEIGQVICHLSSDEAFRSYLNRPDADAKAIRKGWYFTGDLGRLDGDGDLWIVGRMDDMIISGGENVHPFEIEDVLSRHSAVKEVAVVGLPDDRLGQRVVAAVVGDGVTAEELDAHCLAAGDLASFKRPREYVFVKDLAKSSSGKLLRRAVQEQLLAAREGAAKDSREDKQ